MSDARRWVILLVGPPGAGKGTQAELLADDFGLYNFETSKMIEEKFANADPNDAVIQREKEIFKSGKLNTPKLVRQWVIDKVAELSSSGQGIVFSGSPRTLFEAEGELPVFEKLYIKQNIKIVNIEVSEVESIKRNSSRRLCKANRHPIPNFPEFQGITSCPKDSSEIITRVLDNPETIKVRYQTYINETKPVLDFLSKRGYNILEINGDQSIENVHNDVVAKLHKSHVSDHSQILTHAS